jgi:hypothetical protein
VYQKDGKYRASFGETWFDGNTPHKALQYLALGTGKEINEEFGEDASTTSDIRQADGEQSDDEQSKLRYDIAFIGLGLVGVAGFPLDSSNFRWNWLTLVVLGFGTVIVHRYYFGIKP